jgi:hypothetical protein
MSVGARAVRGEAALRYGSGSNKIMRFRDTALPHNFHFIFFVPLSLYIPVPILNNVRGRGGGDFKMGPNVIISF